VSDVLEKIKYLRENSKKRNFVQSFDLSINLKNLDVKRPENRIKGEVVLPHPVPGRKICFFTDSIPVSDPEVTVIKKSEMEKIGKREMKKIAKRHDVFLAEAPLMPTVAKLFGQILGPRNKLPSPVPPGSDVGRILDRARRTVRFSVKKTPVVHCIVGKESMEDEKIKENIEAVISSVTSALPRGREQIKNAYLKLTMSQAVEVKV